MITKSRMIGLAILLFLATSCLRPITYTHDVSDKTRLWGVYDPQKTYVLVRDVFLIRTDLGLILIPESSYRRSLGRHNLAPFSIQEYEKDPKGAALYRAPDMTIPLDVIGIIRAGTRMKCIQLKETAGFSAMFGFGRFLTPYAKIIDGPHSNTIVDITDISIYYHDKDSGLFLFMPEEGVLEVADD